MLLDTATWATYSPPVVPNPNGSESGGTFVLGLIVVLALVVFVVGGLYYWLRLRKR